MILINRILLLGYKVINNSREVDKIFSYFIKIDK